MMIYQPMEWSSSERHLLLIESTSAIRRVTPDGRPWPKQMLPAFAGYSIGQWLDEDATAATTRSPSRPAASAVIA